MRRYYSVAVFFLLACSSLAVWASGTTKFPSFSSEDPYDDVMENIKDAIIGRGLNISNVLHASDMLNRTGPDLGFARNVFSQAQTIEFCSATLSHELVAISPANMVLCPFTISVYMLSDDPKKVYVSYRALSADANSTAVLQKVDRLIRDIIGEAIE